MKHPEGQAPGEYLTESSDAESEREQMRDGTMPDLDPVNDPRRSTLELQPVALQKSDDISGGDDAPIRRTSLDRDNLKPALTPNRAAEERQDQNSGDGTRENVLDPAQDESDPQSDQA